MSAQIRKGFTLIELLIVMAILGVLAVVVLVAINPVQQLARTRDTGRKSTVTQLGHAVQAYYTSRNGTYVPESSSWITALSNAGEIASVPAEVPFSVSTDPGCDSGAGSENRWCYDTNGNTNAVVYRALESNVETSKCTDSNFPRPFYVYSALEGRACVECYSATGFPTASSSTLNCVD